MLGQNADRDYKREKNLLFGRSFSANQNQPHPNLSQKKTKVRLWQKLVYFPLVDTVNHKTYSSLNLYTFSLQKSNTYFSVSNDVIELSLDFGPESVILTVKDLVQ